MPSENDNPQLGLTPGAVTPPAVSATPPPEATPEPAAPPATVAPVVATAAEVQDDAVEAWLAEHPEVPTAETPAAEAVEAPPSAVTPPPVVPDAVTPPVAETPTPAVPEGEKPAAETPTAEAKPVATPEPPKPTFAADEKFALAANPDGTPNEWTREQLVTAVKDAHAFRPKAAQADEFQRIFGMDSDRAKAEWEPVLQRLGSEPETASLIESVFSADPDKREYLARADAHYEAERVAGNLPPSARPAQPTTQQPAATAQVADPALRAELAEFRKFRDQQGLAAATQLFNAQYSAAITKYPFIGTDVGLRNELLQTASILNKMDELAGVPEEKRRGLPDAVAAKASIYDALLTARAAQTAPAAATPVEVPATLGTGGAAATTRPVDDGKPRIFKNGEDPTEDWLRTHPE